MSKVDKPYHSESEVFLPAIEAIRANRDICKTDELVAIIIKNLPYLEADHELLGDGKQKRVDRIIRNLITHKKFINSSLIYHVKPHTMLSDYGQIATQAEIDAEINSIYPKTYKRKLSNKRNHTSPDIDSYDDVPEGELRQVTEWRRKRDQKLSKQRRQWYKDNDLVGVIRCLACGWSSPDQIKNDIVEIHHTKPIAQMKEGEKTSKDDLIALCPNCHRIAHTRKNPLSLEEIKKKISIPY